MLPIRFKPFIGEKYQAQDFKILILGESHYFREKDLKDYWNKEKRIETITIGVVKRFLTYKKTGKSKENWMKTYTTFSNIFKGERQSNKDTIDFWEKCSFYNYVQIPTKGPRISPTNDDFNSSFNALSEVVNEIKPNLIFFWGKRLWNNFPKDNYRTFEKDGHKIHFLKLSYNVPIMVVPHPSSSKFNYRINDKIKDYMKRVKTAGNNVYTK